MIKVPTKPLLSTALSFLLVITTTLLEAGAQQSAPQGSPGYSGQGVPLDTEELQQLVAPIALYPDALVAQILGAATFPDQVAAAAGWLQRNQNLTGTTLMQSVDKQPWDPSVKAITQFPSVLDNMAKSLSWTSALGEAYHTQPADVMSAVQGLRAKAHAAGNLKSGSQITVVQQSPQVIVIQPTNPQVVYVPVYNPTVVYGYPVQTPGYSSAAVATTAILAFGAGIAVGAMMSSNSCCGWGYSYWNCNWHRAQWCTGRLRTTETAPGTAATTVPPHLCIGPTAPRTIALAIIRRPGPTPAGLQPRMPTAAQALVKRTTHPPGPMHVVRQTRTPMAPKVPPKRTTQGRARMAPLSKVPTPTGAGEVRRFRRTAKLHSQHQTTSQGTTGSVQTSNGGKAVGATGQYNSAALAQTANGNKYATANGNTYSNTGSGWSGSPNNTQKSGTSSYSDQSASKSNSASSSAWGQQEKSSGSSAFSSGGGGWQSRSESARGSASRGGGGGWSGGGRR